MKDSKWFGGLKTHSEVVMWLMDCNKEEECTDSLALRFSAFIAAGIGGAYLQRVVDFPGCVWMTQ